jgi:hypothetical protein
MPDSFPVSKQALGRTDKTPNYLHACIVTRAGKG